MNIRSTNIVGFAHHQGDIVSNVGSSHGVALSGGSTGGRMDAFGDDANITLTIAGKGTAALVLGNSSSPVQFGQLYTVQFTPAALSSFAGSASTITVTGLSTSRPFAWTLQQPSGIAVAYNFRMQCSTANELRLVQQNITGSTIGSGESTGRFLLVQA